MREISVVIVDDEHKVRDTIQQWCRRFAADEQLTIITHVYSDGLDISHSYTRGSADIMLLDVEMPGLDGFETAKAIRAIDDQVVIMFITNMAQYAIRGYEVSAVDYVLKPLNYTDFSIKLTKAIRAVSGNKDVIITIDSVDGVRSVPIGELMYIEVLGHYLLFHMKHAVIKARGNMTSQAQALAQYGFYRIHKSYCINLRAIEYIDTNFITCASKQLPLGRAYKAGLMPAYMTFIGGQQL